MQQQHDYHQTILIWKEEEIGQQQYKTQQWGYALAHTLIDPNQHKINI